MWGSWGSSEKKKRYTFSWSARHPYKDEFRIGRISTTGYCLSQAQAQAKKRVASEWNYHGWNIEASLEREEEL